MHQLQSTRPLGPPVHQAKKLTGVAPEAVLQPDRASPVICHEFIDCLIINKSLDPFITIRVRFKTHQTTIHTQAIIDCGATANFISNTFIMGLGVKPSEEPSPPVRDVNNTIITPASKTSTYYLDITIDNKPKRTCFRAIPMAEHCVVLGLPWLGRVNPTIDFTTGTVTMPQDILVLQAEEFLADIDSTVMYLQNHDHNNDISLYTNDCKFSSGDLPDHYKAFKDVFYKDEAETLPPH